MTLESFENHPIQLVLELQDRLPAATFSFSQYFYRPQSPIDERRVFDVRSGQITPDWLTSQLQALPDDWEIALNSLVKDSRARMFHIPMIDFSKRLVSGDDLILMRSILGVSICRTMVFYDSGRSLHAYCPQLIALKEWREFMGRLLLLNLPNQEQLIDSRWVGHRLVSGYCALRWSSNSNHYLKMPTRTNIVLPTVGRELKSASGKQMHNDAFAT